MEVDINYWAVLLSVLAAVALGSVWYGPLFGKVWMKSIGIEMPTEITKAIKKQMMRSYAIQTIATFVMVFVLAHFIAFMNSFMETEGLIAGITAAIWAWVGFVVPTSLGSVLWENRTWKYWFINAGYYLVTFILVSVILAVWP